MFDLSQPPHARGAAPDDAPYIRVPDTLIHAFAHDPTAIGVYLIVARAAARAGGPAPLSAADLVRLAEGLLDSAARTRVMRRITRLIQAGWLVAAETATQKHHLLPTWGRGRDGAARPWQWELPGYAKPDHLATRRVPAALVDDYLGRMVSHAGRRAATIARSFARPLLGLADLGTYAAALLIEMQPTPALSALGLMDSTPRPPRALDSLLADAACGALRTVALGETVAVAPSAQGYHRLGLTPPDHTGRAEEGRGSPSRSGSASLSRSPEPVADMGDLTRSDAIDGARTTPNPTVTWIHEIMKESINPPPLPPDRTGGGGSGILCEEVLPDAPHPPALDPEVADGHRSLNAGRLIPPEEWDQIRELADANGARALLTWQERARQAGRSTLWPAYYAACAAHLAAERVRPPVQPHRPPAAPALDPERQVLLDDLGVACRHDLAHVPLEALRAWQQALQHGGLARRFASPTGFAVSQLRLGIAPPPKTTLDRWAEGPSGFAPSAHPTPAMKEAIHDAIDTFYAQIGIV